MLDETVSTRDSAIQVGNWGWTVSSEQSSNKGISVATTVMAYSARIFVGCLMQGSGTSLRRFMWINTAVVEVGQQQ